MGKRISSRTSLATSLSWSQKTSVLVLLLLALEFLLGIYTNLYVSLPKHSSNSGSFFAMSNMMSSRGSLSPLFMIHMMIGPMIIGIGLVALVLALKSKNQTEILFTIIGLFSLVIAGWSGLVFFMGSRQNSYSFIMASGFLISFMTYFSQLVWGSKNIDSL